MQSMPDHSGPHTPHGHEYSHAYPPHAHTRACIHTHIPPRAHAGTRMSPVHSDWPDAHTHAFTLTLFTQTDLTHTYAFTCTAPRCRLSPGTCSLTAGLALSCDRTLWGHKLSHPQGAGRQVSEGGAEGRRMGTRVWRWRRAASWEHRPKAARASEFLRETEKLNFYVKYPDF